MNQIQELHDALKIAPSDILSVGQDKPGGKFTGGRNSAQAIATRTYDKGRNYWAGANVLTDKGSGRGGAKDIQRIPAIVLDLDAKPGGLGDLDTCEQVIDDLAAILGTRPVAVVNSGHGLQPYWAVDADDSYGVAAMAMVLHRCVLLAQVVARVRGGSVDPLTDAARIWRIPGTWNVKDPEHPVEVTLRSDSGYSLTVEQVREALDAHGIPEVEPGDLDRKVTSPPGDWRYADQTCAYASAMISGWATDEPDTGRHQWLLTRGVRLAAAHRAGCLSEGDHDQARKALGERFVDLLRGGKPKREPGRHEVASALSYGVAVASRKTDKEVWKELGGKPHRHVVDAADGHVDAVDGVVESSDGFVRTDSSDLALAVWFLHEHRDRVIYVPEMASWLVWDGVVWRSPSAKNPLAEVSALLSHYVQSRIKDLSQSAYDAAYDDPDNASDPEKYAEDAAAAMRRRLKTAAKHRAVLAMVEVRGPSLVRTSWDRLDVDPEILNCANGIVNLRTGEPTAHDPNAYCTMSTRVDYDPTATAPRWIAALEQAQPDPEIRSYLQRRAGAALIGAQRDHVLHVDYGEVGRNGKGLHDEMLYQAAGDYGAVLNSEKLLVQRNDPHPEWLVRLRGRRIIWIDETREQRSLDSARVKQFTGGAPRECREMHGATTYYKPSDTTILSTNRMPKFDGGDQALEGRLRVVNWDQTFLGREDTGLAEHVRQHELPGVLAWMVQGARDYLSAGLAPPKAVTDGTREHVVAANPVATWAEEETEIVPGAAAALDDMHRRFLVVLRDSDPNAVPPSRSQFTRDLKAHLDRAHGSWGEHKKAKVEGRSVWALTNVHCPKAAASERHRPW